MDWKPGKVLTTRNDFLFLDQLLDEYTLNKNLTRPYKRLDDPTKYREADEPLRDLDVSFFVSISEKKSRTI